MLTLFLRNPDADALIRAVTEPKETPLGRNHIVGVTCDDGGYIRGRALAAQLRSAVGSYQVRIRDISPLGARIDADRLPAPGTIVCLQCGVAALFGAMAWAEDGQGGILFDEEVDTQLFGAAGDGDGDLRGLGASAADDTAKRRFS